MKCKNEKEPYFDLKLFFMKNGITHDEPAEKLGIARSTFSLKINRVNKNDFKGDEIRALCKVYKLDANKFFL